MFKQMQLESVVPPPTEWVLEEDLQVRLRPSCKQPQEATGVPWTVAYLLSESPLPPRCRNTPFQFLKGTLPS